MRIPVVLQAEAAECGIACLTMVAGHFGHGESLRDLRSRFRMSQRGTTLLNIRDFANRLGFQSRAVKVDMHELHLLRRPAILHWNFDHFVVLVSVSRQRVKIIDPAVGERSLPLNIVSQHFTGVALELTPTPSFTPAKGTEALPLSSFFSAFKGLGGSLLGVFAMTVALQGFALAMPLQAQFTIDQGIRQGDWGLIVALAVGFGMVGFISSSTTWFRSLLVQHVGNTSSFRMIAGLGHHLLRLSDDWFEGRHTGDVMSRFASTAPVREFLTTGMFALIIDALMAVSALFVLLLYSGQLALITMAFFATLLLVQLGSFRWLRDLSRESIVAKAHEDTSFIENVERQRAIKLLGAEDSREGLWVERLVNRLNCETRLVRFTSHISYASSIIVTAQGVCLHMLAAGKVIEGTFTLGMFMAFSAYTALLSSHAHSAIHSIVDFRMLRLHRERISDIAIEESEESVEAASVRKPVRGLVEIKNLSFSYADEGPLILDDFNLSIEPGEFVVLQGASGSGKSTLIKLLCKLLQAQQGTISIGGHDLQSFETGAYRRSIGVVMQYDDLFTGNLLENVAVNPTELDEDKIHEAARLACIHEEIMQMPMEYMTRIGHMGSTLSGGQRQRVMIARVFFRRPSIVLLDEGTAHLNDPLQQQIISNLEATGATLIVASHDSRVVDRADRCIEIGRN